MLNECVPTHTWHHHVLCVTSQPQVSLLSMSREVSPFSCDRAQTADAVPLLAKMHKGVRTDGAMCIFVMHMPYVLVCTGFWGWWLHATSSHPCPDANCTTRIVPSWMGSACAVYTDHTMTHHDTATADSWLSSCISVLLQSMVMQRRKHMWRLLEASNERWVYHVLTVPSLQCACSVHTSSSHAHFATSSLYTWWHQYKYPAWPMQAHPATLPTWCKVSKPCWHLQ